MLFRSIPLFSRSMPDIRFVPKSPTFDENRYDTHLPIGSLCQYLRPNAEAFARTPRACLRADPVRSAALRTELQVPGKRLCGISWRSGGLKTGAARSITLRELVAALDTLDLTLVNLQYGNVDAEIEAGDAVDLVLADGGDQHAHGARDEAFQKIVSGEARGDRHGEQDQCEVIPRSELQTDAGELRGERHQQDGADGAAAERGPYAQAEGEPIGDDEIVMIVSVLIGAGSETTNLGGMVIIQTLLQHPEPLERVRRDRKSTRLNSSHMSESRMPSSA